METLQIKGQKRTNFGKKNLTILRREANVPCVLYGNNNDPIHFIIHMSLLRNFLYTPSVYFINIDIEGTVYKTILQDVHFHPVSEMVLHMDFLHVTDDKEIKVEIPIKCVGESPGIMKGGVLSKRVRRLKIKGLPKNLPVNITVDISNLDLNESVKVKDIKIGDFKILLSPYVPVVSIAVPRALKSKQGTEESKTEETASANSGK